MQTNKFSSFSHFSRLQKMRKYSHFVRSFALICFAKKNYENFAGKNLNFQRREFHKFFANCCRNNTKFREKNCEIRTKTFAKVFVPWKPYRIGSSCRTPAFRLQILSGYFPFAPPPNTFILLNCRI